MIVDLEDDSSGAGGLHDITKKTNYWFNFEIGRLEASARGEAEAWARQGLPRHDLRMERDEWLPVEEALAARAIEIFRQWIERVRTKTQDAINAAARAVAGRLTDYRFHLSQLEQTVLDVRKRERELSELRKSLEGSSVSFGYKRLIGTKAFWALTLVIVGIEFAANYPVFRLLLPMDEKLGALFAQQTANAERWGMFAGPYRLFSDMMFHTEATIVALVAVVALVILGKSLGASARTWFALNPDEVPRGGTTIQNERRQNMVLAISSLVGLACVVAFLFFARQQIATNARAVVQQDSVRVVELEKKSASAMAAGDMQTVGATQQSLSDAGDVLGEHKVDRGYAEAVERINGPVLLLNLALVIAAAVLGFMHHTDELEDRSGRDPEVLRLQRIIDELRSDALSHRQRIREADVVVQSEIARARYLLHSRPLQEWQAKEKRLQGVIPLFRADNARLRGMDPASILAFQKDAVIPLPTDEVEEAFRTPDVLTQSEQEFEALRTAFGELNDSLGLFEPNHAA